MTVPAAERKAGPFNGNGSTTSFPFEFKVFTTADVEIVVADADGIETVLELDSDYSVSLNSDQDATPGGTVTYPISGAALATGEKLSIAGAIAYEQETDIPTGGNFNPTVLENALDKLSMQTQQLAEAISRAAKVPITNAADADTLTQAIIVAANNIDGLNTIATNINDIQTVADDLNEATSEIETVAGSIANVNVVGNNISNVNAVAGISSAVSTVATNIADIQNAEENADAAAASASAAAASESAAAASAAAAAASLDNFDDRYLGSKSTAPTVDNDGNALTAGALYFNNGGSVPDDKGMYVYDGGTWIAASSASQAIMVVYKYAATSGQTVFTGADANGLTLSYTAGSIIVAVGGVVQSPSTYTATNGSTVTFSGGVSAGVVVDIYAFSTFDIANTYTQAQADAKYVGKDAPTGAAFIPSGTTAQRPVSPVTGYLRFNTTINAAEVWNGTVWERVADQGSSYFVDYLIIAGGASGGTNGSGSGGPGGGGAGGYISTRAYAVSVGAAFSLVVGAGGAGKTGTGTGQAGNSGSNSSGFGLTAIGGGAGAGAGSSGGVSGGSGGGGNYTNGGGSGTAGQGFAGGAGDGGGGGGAGAAGAAGGSGGAGGNGLAWLDGVTRAGGGGGYPVGGVAGTGGATAGYVAAGLGGASASATANTGSGSGASSGTSGVVTGNGGSGVVIVRYAGAQKGTGGTVTSSGGYTYHTFTTSGTFTA